MMNHIGGLGPLFGGNPTYKPPQNKIQPVDEISLKGDSQRRLSEMDDILKKREKEEDNIGMLADLLLGAIQRRDDLGIFGNYRNMKRHENRQLLRDLKERLVKLGV